MQLKSATLPAAQLAAQRETAVITTLLVDDNRLFRQVLKEALLAYFPAMQIKEASEGVQALKIVREYCPDLIVMDLKLPGENGLNVTKKIKHVCPQTRVIILSAYIEPEYLQAATEAGAVCFLLKGSVRMEDIAAALHEIMAT